MRALLLIACIACGAAQPIASGPRDLVASDGAKLSVHVAGHGPPCMFIHGGPGQDSLSFEKMGGDALEAFATMIYVDQRGSGHSPDAGDYRLARVVDDFEDIRKQLGVDRMCLIAHSFGGILALDYALRYPQRVSALVMANTTLHFLGPDQGRMQIAFANQIFAERGMPAVAIPDDPAAISAAQEAATTELARHTDQQWRLITTRLENLKRFNQLESSYPRSNGFGDFVMAHRDGEYFADYTSQSARVTAPTLIIASVLDRAVGPDEHTRFRFPHATVAKLPGGHMSYADDPAAFTAAVRDFLAKR